MFAERRFHPTCHDNVAEGYKQYQMDSLNGKAKFDKHKTYLYLFQITDNNLCSPGTTICKAWFRVLNTLH